MKLKREKVVLVFHSSARSSWSEALSGIYRYARLKGWNVQVIEHEPNRKSIAELLVFWQPAGVIVEGGVDEKGVFLSDVFDRVPTVYLACDQRQLQKNALHVNHDSESIGRLAAREFLSLGLGSFAYFGFTGMFWSEERGRCFGEALRLNGHEAQTFTRRFFESGEGTAEKGFRALFAAWLKKLPKPCGLFAANDLLAVEALNVRRATLRVLPRRRWRFAPRVAKVPWMNSARTASRCIRNSDGENYKLLKIDACVFTAGVSSAIIIENCYQQGDSTRVSERTGIYYWKCDRASAFHGTSDYLRDQSALEGELRRVLTARLGARLAELRPALEGQGNHRTFRATVDGREVFIRTEDGVEGDGYFAVEAEVTRRLAELGVSVPETLAYDCAREEAPFAWQAIPYLPYGDLNGLAKAGRLDWSAVAPQIGRAIASWQAVTAPGFGPFSARAAMRGELRPLHATAEGFYRLNLDRHLAFLGDHGFFTAADILRINRAIEDHAFALRRSCGVLVHKDLAIWNILGTEKEAKFFIDWDDCIIGDEMDDLSLMGVTQDEAVAGAVLAAYAETRPLAADAPTRFWLCWLRNILFKAVIRQGAGYFDKHDDGFFLIGSGGDGRSLSDLTHAKIDRALKALEQGEGFDNLN